VIKKAGGKAETPASDTCELKKARRVRDRIFDTARELFYRHGIRGVGVDTIADRAGTNKMSFYRSFTSKDELVAECLRESDRMFWQWWDETVAVHPDDPRRQVEALFDHYVKNTCRRGDRGCAIANAAVELSGADHPASAVVRKHKAEVRRRFRQLARAMGAPDPAALGDALTLLMEGSNLARLTFDAHSGPAATAARAARALMDAYLSGV
jgi:AcrR family transcriptional regulator